MAYVVLFLYILLPWTICVGNEKVPTLELCIIGMSSHYSSVSKYCTSDSIKNEAKEDVCSEVFQLFDKMCSFNRSATAFHWPEPQNVSETNCVSLCAGLDTQYILRMFDEGSGSCKTLCSKDLKAVAVLSTLFQLKDFIAELKENQTVETVTNSTLEQSNSSSGAAGENGSASNKADTTLTPVTTEKTPTPNVKTTTTEKKKVSSTKPDLNATTTATTRPSAAKSTEKSITTADATEKMIEPAVKPTITEKKPAPNLKTTTTEKRRVLSTKPDLIATTTAAGGNDSSLKEADTTLKPVTTEKTPTLNLKTTTTGERMVSSTNKDVKKTEQQEELIQTTINNEESNAKNEMPEDDISNTDKKEEKSKLNKESERPSSLEDEHSSTNEKDETSKLDDTPSSYHFLIYFLAFIVLCVAAYIVFHNKHKIIAFIIEGKQGRRGGRPSTKQYTPLKSKVEDVMPFIEKSTTQSNYIY